MHPRMTKDGSKLRVQKVDSILGDDAFGDINSHKNTSLHVNDRNRFIKTLAEATA